MLTRICTLALLLLLSAGCSKKKSTSSPTPSSTSGSAIELFSAKNQLASGPFTGVRWGMSAKQLRGVRPATKAMVPTILVEQLAGRGGIARVWYSFLNDKGLYKVKADFALAADKLLTRATKRFGKPTRVVVWRKVHKIRVWSLATQQIEVRLQPHMLQKTLIRLTIRKTSLQP